MSGVLDRDAIEQLISDGRAQALTSGEIADQIIALAEDPTWAEATSHPSRAAILRLLRRNGALSPARAAEQLDASLGSIAYHFRALERLGLVEVCDQIPRRGAIEHVYRLKTSGG